MCVQIVPKSGFCEPTGELGRHVKVCGEWAALPHAGLLSHLKASGILGPQPGTRKAPADPRTQHVLTESRMLSLYHTVIGIQE